MRDRQDLFATAQARFLASVLVPGGMLMMEMGVHESEILSDMLSNHGYTGIQIRKDYAGIDRMILATLP